MYELLGCSTSVRASSQHVPCSGHDFRSGRSLRLASFDVDFCGVLGPVICPPANLQTLVSSFAVLAHPYVSWVSCAPNCAVVSQSPQVQTLFRDLDSLVQLAHIWCDKRCTMCAKWVAVQDLVTSDLTTGAAIKRQPRHQHCFPVRWQSALQVRACPSQILGTVKRTIPRYGTSQHFYDQTSCTCR